MQEVKKDSPEVEFMRRWNQSSESKAIPLCQLCGSAESREEFVKDNTPVYACLQCGMRFTSLSGRDPKIFEGLYNKEFFEGKDEGFESSAYLSYEKRKEAVVGIVKKRLEFVSQWVRGGKLLELGSAMGFGLEAAQGAGFEPTGYEISEWAASYAREKTGLEVVTEELAEYSQKAEGSFDIVTGYDILTHMAKPASDLKSVRRLLKPGGLLFVEEGIYDSPMARFMGNRWVHYAFPYHIHFFSRATLKKMLEKEGFEIVGEKYLPRCDKLHELIAIVAHNFLPAPLGKLSRAFCSVLPNLMLKYNSFNNLAVVAKKRTD